MLMMLVPAYVVFLLALISPGPDFALIVRNGVRYGERAGVFTALGIALGNLSYILLINIGLGALIAQSAAAFSILKILAAAYLVYIGIRALSSKPYSINDNLHAEKGKLKDRDAFMQGLITNALNPKAAMFWLSYFALIVDPEISFAILCGFITVMMITVFLWFSIIAWCLSRKPIRRQFLKLGHWFDRLTGGALILLGIKVALTSRQ